MASFSSSSTAISLKCSALLVLMIFIQRTRSEPNMCGVAQMDPMKTCVSVRLPWQPEPMYFCIEKDKFKYRSACMGQNMMNNCGMNMREDALMVGTPWDCCPMVSVPDHCMNSWCPPKPMNRECKLLELDMYGDCCQKYFCEPNATPEDCHMKQMQPDCNTPPKDKTNCVGFYDMYGCCTKYQCQGEGKPGMCPMEAHMKQWNDRFANGSMGGAPPPPMSRSDPRVQSATSTLYPQVVPPPMGMNKMPTLTRTQQASMSMYARDIYTYGSLPVKSMPCINDNNCEGAQKCCSNDASVYANGAHMMRNSYPTYGYCSEPVTM